MTYKERQQFVSVHGAMKCIKYLLFGFNLLFFLIGLGLIITGAAVQSKFQDIANVIGETELSPAIVLMGIGLIILIVAFFGCCGALRENYCMLITFSVFIGLIFVLEIGVAVTGIVLKEKIGKTVKKGLTDSVNKYEKDKAIHHGWDFIQTQFECCGAQNFTDWFAVLGKNTVPPSCCKKQNDADCGKNIGKSSEIFRLPCLTSVQKLFEENVLNMVISAVVVTVCQILGIILGCCLAKNIRAQYEIIQ